MKIFFVIYFSMKDKNVNEIKIKEKSENESIITS